MKTFIFLVHTKGTPTLSQIVEIVALKISDDSSIETFSRTIRPEIVLSDKDCNDLGTTNGILRSAPVFVDIINDFLCFIENCSVKIYDSKMARVLKNKFIKIGLPINFTKTTLVKDLARFEKRFKNVSFQSLVKMNFLQSNSTFLEQCHWVLELALTMDEAPFNIPDTAFAKAENESLNDLKSVVLSAPNGPGCYQFLNDSNEAIYVGKAKSLKKRLKSHLQGKEINSYRIIQNASKLEIIPTGTELIAKLVESFLIYQLQPKFNTQQTNQISPWIITSKIDGKGILRIRVEEKNFSNECEGLMFNRSSVVESIKKLKILFQLCPKFSGLERTAGSCSDDGCKGICRGEEDIEVYNLRVQKAMFYLNKNAENFYLKLPGRDQTEDSFILVQEDFYRGYGFIPKSAIVNSLNDLESYLISQPHNYFTSRSINEHIIKYKTVKYPIT